MNASPRVSAPLAPPSDRQKLYQDFLNFKKSTRGITPATEKWFKDTVWTFLQAQPKTVDVSRVSTSDIITFLGKYNQMPWRKHGFYRALKLLYKWLSTTYHVGNPYLDEHGNSVIAAPKLPQKTLPTMDPDTAFLLVAYAETSKNRAIVALLLESGARRSELANIQVADLNLTQRRIKVLGKGNKEGNLIYGDFTERLLKEYIEEYKPTDSLFGLSSDGIQSMLRRLEKQSGFKCNAHTFRRGFATELRKKGLNELDIAELGRWNSTAMVKRYTRAFEFEDAAARYQDII